MPASNATPTAATTPIPGTRASSPAPLLPVVNARVGGSGAGCECCGSCSGYGDWLPTGTGGSWLIAPFNARTATGFNRGL